MPRFAYSAARAWVIDCTPPLPAAYAAMYGCANIAEVELKFTTAEVDQHVQAAQCVDGCGHPGLDRCLVADVDLDGGEALGVGARLLDRVGEARGADALAPR